MSNIILKELKITANKLCLTIVLVLISFWQANKVMAQNAPVIAPSTGAYASQPNNGNQLVTVSGTITANDTVSVIVFDSGLNNGFENVSYTVQASDTLTSIATALTNAINNDTNLQAIKVTATSNTSNITLASSSPNSTSYSQTTSLNATEVLTLSLTVTITGDSGATFYYTLDGSQPTTSSPQYSQPFNISATTTVKAIEQLNGQLSPVTTSFIQIDPLSAGLPRANMQLWLKSDNSVTTSSGNVTAWGDISGNGNNATQTNTGNQPTFLANAINNLPAIVFNGNSSYLNIASGFANFTNGATIYLVVKSVSGGGGQFFDFSDGTDFNNRFDMWQYTNNGVEFEVFNSSGNDSQLQAPSASPIGSYVVLQITHDGVSTATINTNGLVQAINTNMNAITNSTRTTNLIGKYSLGSNILNGQIAEMIVYNQELSSAQQYLAQDYLLRRYSLQLMPPSISPNTIIDASGSQTVTITADPNNVIYYTLDGSQPTTSSTLYTGPFQVNTTTTVNAISAYGSNTSSVATSYIKFDSATSNVPRNGLALWLRSDNGVALNNANNLITWYDSSNNLMNAQPASSSNPPLVQNNSSIGYPQIVLNGSNSLRLPTGLSNFSQGMTVFYLVKPLIFNNSFFFDFSNGSNFNSRIDYWQNNNTSSLFEVYNSTGGDSQLNGGSSVALGNYQLLEIVHNGVNTATMYTNSAQQVQNTSMNSIATTNRTSNFIGQYGLNSSNYLTGKITEILIYNRAITSSELTAVQEYFGQRYAPNVTPTTGVYSSTNANISSFSGDPVYYTLDGSQPTTSSPQYTAPFIVGKSTTINAITSTANGLSPINTEYIDIDPVASLVPKTNLNLWLRPNYGILTNGSNVTNWIDLSGSYMNASQSNTANQPQLVPNQINGYGAVSFNGSSNYLQMPTGFANFSTGATGFVVLKPNAFNNYSRLIDLTNGTNGNALSFYLAATSGLGLTTQAQTASTSIVATSGAVNNQYQLLEFSHNGSGTATLFQNAGTLISSSTMNNIDTINRISNYIGSDYTGNNLLTGQIVEVMLYNTGLSSALRGSVEGYLLQKYQLASVLPNAPIFSVNGGNLNNPILVEINGPTNSSIYYTLDGSQPTTTSPQYSQPIPINYTTTLSAIAVVNGVASSVTSATYTLNNNTYPAPSTADKTTPVINLNTPVTQ